jgi:membrane fusion protein (multidrug efflux system)
VDTTTRSARTTSSKTGSIARWLFLLAALGAVGYLIYSKVTRDKAKKASNERAGGGGPNARGGAGGGGPMRVDGYVVRAEQLDNTLESSGTLQSNEEVEIRPELSARVVTIYFREGTAVAKGAMLVKLYDGDLLAQLQKLRSQRELSAKTSERQQYLLAKGGVSQQEADVAAAQVESFDADIALIQTQIQKTNIRAPFSGTIGLRAISEGAIVTPTTVMATLQQTNPLKVDFSVPEKYSKQVRKGDPVEFSVASDEKAYRGTVYAIEPKVDLTTRTVRLRALVPNPNNTLRPGQFAEVRLKLGTVSEAILVPTQAIIPGVREKQLIVQKNGKASFVTVETGTRLDKRIQITKGVQPGDTVVTSGMLQLKPDMPVKIARVQKP